MLFVCVRRKRVMIGHVSNKTIPPTQLGFSDQGPEPYIKQVRSLDVAEFET